MDAKSEIPTSSATAPKRIVKRYSNRKLYDTKDSRYVTLLQIAEMVRTGEEVQIIDNNSKEDLTEVTLAQIIYEEKKANSRAVPLQTLKDLIHTRTEKVLSDLREGPIGRLIPGGKDKASEETTPEPIEETAPKVGFDERIKALLTSWTPWQELTAEVKRLNARIDDLEKKLKSAGRRDGGREE